MVKSLPAVQETQVLSLGWEDLLQNGMEILYSILARRIPWTEVPGHHSPRGCQESDTTEQLALSQTGRERENNASLRKKPGLKCSIL